MSSHAFLKTKLANNCNKRLTENQPPSSLIHHGLLTLLKTRLLSMVDQDELKEMVKCTAFKISHSAFYIVKSKKKMPLERLQNLRSVSSYSGNFYWKWHLLVLLYGFHWNHYRFVPTIIFLSKRTTFKSTVIFGGVGEVGNS